MIGVPYLRPSFAKYKYSIPNTPLINYQQDVERKIIGLMDYWIIGFFDIDGTRNLRVAI
jgi:hypothetical protein